MGMNHKIPDYTACSIQPTCFLSALCKTAKKYGNLSPIVQQDIDKGTTVWMNLGECTDSDYLYVVYSGAVACVTYTMEGDINCHALKGKGHTANEMCLFSNYDLPWAITALTDVVLCRVKMVDAEKLILSNREMVPRIFKSIFESTVAVDAYTNMLVMRSVYDRIKEFSLLMAECLGRTGKKIKITLTHNELAYLIKANRVTVTKVLSQLENEGFIERGNKSFNLLVDAETNNKIQ